MSPELVLAGLLLSAALPATGSIRPSCTLEVTASPDRLMAREDRRILLHVSTAEAPRIASSEGHVEDVRRGEDGSWTAVLVAPPVSIPQVAIVTVLAGDTCGFTAVPIHGAGEALVRTRPGSVVQVLIAGRAFGPARAGGDGVAVIPVEVPPGVYSAQQGSRSIPLGLPRVRHVAVQLDRDEIPADREATVGVLVVAVADDGKPRALPPPAVRVSAGEISPLRPAGPGAYRATWRLPVGRPGTAVVRASLPGEEHASAAVSRPPGPPSTLAVSLDRERAVAGDPVPVRLTLTLSDAAGNPTDGPVRVEVSGASASPPAKNGPGTYESTVATPARLPEGRRAEVVARSGSLRAPAVILLEPGPPSRVELHADARVVTANGKQSTTVHVRVLDAHGNPVDAPPEEVRVSAGEAGPTVRDGPGAFSFTYVPTHSRTPGSGSIEVTVGGETARTILPLRPALAVLSLSASAGVALRPGGGSAGLHGSVEASHWRWLGGREAGLSLSAGWSLFRDQESVPVDLSATSFRGEVRELVLLLSAGWRSRSRRSFRIEASAGPGVARVTSLVALGGAPSIPEVAWAPAAGGALSLARRVGPGHALLELRAVWVKDPGLDSLDAPASPVSLSMGYRLDAL